jgi:hypothetical protein
MELHARMVRAALEHDVRMLPPEYAFLDKQSPLKSSPWAFDIR